MALDEPLINQPNCEFVASYIIIISYCINTTKYWLRAIFKENEIANSPLTLHKANILWY